MSGTNDLALFHLKFPFALQPVTVMCALLNE